MHALSVSDVRKNYDSVEALKGLTFDAEKGSLYGLIGPDGAGKTTFMRIAVCLLMQNGGTLQINGFDTIRDSKKIKTIVGYMPQRFSLYPDLSVEENLMFFADLFGVSSSERSQRIDKLLEFSRLGPFLKRRAGALSGGMKQKLALSCALIHTPEVLFLDEPTTGVDPVSRREFWNLLGEIRSRGTTIIVSTPYMDEAEKCDRVGFIMHGAFLMEGRPAEIPRSFRREIIAVRAPGIVKRSHGMKFPPIVRDTQAFGDRINLTVDSYAKSSDSIRRFLDTHNLRDATIDRIRPTMEDVFMDNITHDNV